MKHFIIDTNFFVNMEVKSGFGTTSKDVITNFVPIARNLVSKKEAEFFVPPRIEEELKSFFEGQPFYADLLSVLQIKSPHVSEITFPASIFYQLVEEIRERSYRGLRIAEEAVEQGALKGTQMEDKTDRIVFQKTIGESVKHLRERYRQATRFNFLDSVADLDLIVLTKELDGSLVSSDEGVIRWGRIFGIKEVLPHSFRDVLLGLSDPQA